jgi:hypothetical protein
MVSQSLLDPITTPTTTGALLNKARSKVLMNLQL